MFILQQNKNQLLCHLLIVPQFVPLEQRCLMTFCEKADTCFDSCWTSVLAVLFGDKKVSLILLTLPSLFRKSIGDTDSSTAKHRGYTIAVAIVTGFCLLNKLNLHCTEDKNES